MVDRVVAAAAALAQYLPVLESGDDVFDSGPDAAVRPLAVGCCQWVMVSWAIAATGTGTVATSGDVGMARRRGKSKAPNFTYDGPVSVIRLELDVPDIGVRRRLERQWEAAFRLRRALQRDVADRCRAYWAAHHERRRDPKALRQRLGLTRNGIEAAAKSHIEASTGTFRHTGTLICPRRCAPQRPRPCARPGPRFWPSPTL